MSDSTMTLTENEVDTNAKFQEELDNIYKPEMKLPDINLPFLDVKNIIILILVILLLFSMLGINLIQFISNIIEYVANALKPIFGSVLSAVAYLTGITLNTTTDVVADTAKTGLDIVEDSIQGVGNLLINASKRDYDTEISSEIESSAKEEAKDEPESDTTETPIQNSIAYKKQSWCLVGDVNNRRTCASIDESTKCMSGEIFPNMDTCKNPNLITNVLPDKQRLTLVN